MQTLFIFFVLFGFLSACKPAVEESSDVQDWKTTKSFWNRNQGVVYLNNFKCVTEINGKENTGFGSYGGGCENGGGPNVENCSVSSGKKNVPHEVSLNKQKTIRDVTCDYIQNASDNFQESYASGKCSAWFYLTLFYKDPISKPKDPLGDLYVAANPSTKFEGTDLRKALIDHINSDIEGSKIRGQEKLKYIWRK